LEKKFRNPLRNGLGVSLRKIFPSKNFWNPKFMIQTSRKHSKHTKIRKHTSCRQWEQNQWTQIDPNEIYQNQKMQKWSKWNHKKTMRAKENGREQHAMKKTTYQWEHEQESETECKRECMREKMTAWVRENCEEATSTRVKMREGDKKCKSKNSVRERKNKGLLR